MIILGKSRVVATTVALALASSLSLTLAAPAAAQPADKPAPKPAAAAAAPAKPGDAKGLFASGEKKFKANDFAGALADFEASQTAKADPATERYIALSHDNLQHFTEAVAAYEKFIAENPPKMKDQVEEAKKRVEAIKAMPGKVKIETTPAGASVVIDTAQTPYEKVTPVEIELAPGKHTLLIGAEGFENATKEVEVTYASKQDVKAELVKKEAPPPPPPPVAAEQPAPAPAPPAPPPEPRSKVPAYVTGAVAVVAAGVGTAFGIKALNQSSDFDKNPTTKKADDGENNALVADMMFGIAITFGVTSAVLFLSNDSPSTAKAQEPTKTASAPKPKKKNVTVIPAPYVSPTGGGFGTVIKF
jgi:PEGA domain